MDVNNTYSQVRSQILLKDFLPQVVKTYSLILQDDAQCLLSRPPSLLEAFAMATTSNYPIASSPMQKHDLRNVVLTIISLATQTKFVTNFMTIHHITSLHAATTSII